MDRLYRICGILFLSYKSTPLFVFRRIITRLLLLDKNIENGLSYKDKAVVLKECDGQKQEEE